MARFAASFPHPGNGLITMSIGQWDTLLAAAYYTGWTLLELDENERPVAAYRKTDTASLSA